MVCGLTVFALYLYFFVGFNKIFLVVEGVNLTDYLVFYSLAIGTMLLVMLFWVLSWRTLLGALKVKISVKNAYLYYWTGFFVDLIVPCQQVCGEVTRLYLVQKETQENIGAIGAAGVTNRVIGYSVVTSGLTAGAIYLLVRGRIPSFATLLLILSWIGAMSYLSVLLYLALSPNAAEKMATVILRVLKALKIRKYREGGTLSPRQSTLPCKTGSFYDYFICPELFSLRLDILCLGL